jgi:hypothetical protein
MFFHQIHEIVGDYFFRYFQSPLFSLFLKHQYVRLFTIISHIAESLVVNTLSSAMINLFLRTKSIQLHFHLLLYLSALEFSSGFLL